MTTQAYHIGELERTFGSDNGTKASQEACIGVRHLLEFARIVKRRGRRGECLYKGLVKITQEGKDETSLHCIPSNPRETHQCPARQTQLWIVRRVNDMNQI